MTVRTTAVIGGGVIGLSIAWRLIEAGAEVIVFDAGAAEPSASEAAAGMLAPGFELGASALGAPLFDLSRASLARWPHFAAEIEAASGYGVDFRTGGVLGLAFDAAAAGLFAERAAAIAARGGAARLLNAEAARRREPSIAADVCAAIFAPDEAQVDPRLVVVALRRAIRRAGGQIVECRVRALAARNGRISEVHAEGADPVRVDAIALAAGHSVGDMALPIPAPPVFPVLGEALSVRATAPAYVVRAPGAYLCPKADGRVVIGATEMAHARRRVPDPAAIERLRAAAARAVPQIADAPEIERWTGLRPGTPDGAPILGRDPRGPENLWLALGHYRNGVLLAPETAALIAPAILEARDPRVLAPFRPDRFPLPSLEVVDREDRE